MQKKLYAPGLAGLLSLVAAAPAVAQTPRHQDVTVQTFDDADLVDGSRSTANGDMIRARIRLSRHSLVQPRTAFVRELLKSVEDT
ncbi:MAG: hypothetical protein GXP55_15555 [Deltaproteobacteria bacterium]|nr:hypothetical protein [Deltaproteobacteria bacterium]